MADMRGERTRALLRGALIGLLKAKPLEKVTVKEVIEAASVSKKAFYNHYADIFDLAIDAYYSETGFGGSYTPSEGGAALTDVCFAVLGNMVDQLEFSRDNPNLTRAIMMNTGRSPYYDRAEAVGGVEYLTGFIADAYGEPRQALVSRETCARYIFNGAMGLCRDWVRAGMVEPPTAVAKRCLLLNLQCASLIAGGALDPAVERAIEEWGPRAKEPRAGGPRAKEPRALG